LFLFVNEAEERHGYMYRSIYMRQRTKLIAAI